MPTLASPLLTALRGQIACDGGDVVAGIVQFVVSRRWSLRVLARWLDRSPRAAVAVMVGNAIRCYAGVRCPSGGGVLVAARRPNERRVVEEFRPMMADDGWTSLSFEWRPSVVAAALSGLRTRPLTQLRRTSRLARRLLRRYGVFRALRGLELIAYYRRYSELVTGTRFSLAVMSSHSNPHGIALNAAAWQFGIPVVLITHGMPVRPIARLHYRLAVLECEAARRVYADAGCRMDHVVIKSRRHDYKPLPGGEREPDGFETVAVCLSKDPVEARVISCLRMLLADRRVRRVLVRPHPVNLWRNFSKAIRSLADERIEVRPSGPLIGFLNDCDLVLGGNSTVLLDALVAGRPAGYVRGLDHGPLDVQDFVRDRLVYELPEHPRIEAAAIARFYGRPEWPEILRQYAAVDTNPEDVARAVRFALSKQAQRDRHVA